MQTYKICRLPPGRRGLKRRGTPWNAGRRESPSPRKAWIETLPNVAVTTPSIKSPSPRKAWIETLLFLCGVVTALVAFPPEGVD